MKRRQFTCCVNDAGGDVGDGEAGRGPAVLTPFQEGKGDRPYYVIGFGLGLIDRIAPDLF